MPLYEYQCLPERHTFEVRQGINEDPVTVCPQCGGPVRRVIQPVGIVFKGSGFYVNDSRKSTSSTSPAPAGGKSEDSGGDSKGESAPAAGADGTSTPPKADSKPAPKSEPAPAS